MKLLAIDVGKKRIGLATCDPVNGVIFPKGQILQKAGKNKALDELNKFCVQESVDRIICGIPLDEEDEIGENAKFIVRFAKLLERKTGIKVEFVDESFSTKEAIAKMPEFRKDLRDEFSAIVILERYLEAQKKSKR